MSFNIDIQPYFDFKIIRITDNESNVSIDIATKGGILNSWLQSDKETKFDIIDGNDLSDGWKNFESNGFKSAKMNPFCCRLNQGNYQYNGKAYKIEKFYLNEHAIHGIIYDELFEISKTEINDQFASIWLTYQYQKKDSGFPFEYHVELKWTLWKENKIVIETKITNDENIAIPMIDGWHPYFKLGENIDDCRLQFKTNGLMEYNKDLIPTKIILPNHEFENGKYLKDIFLDNGYLLDPNHSRCVLENNNYKVLITPDHNYTYLQIYTPPHRKSIAIENLTGAPDSFNNKMGLHIMQPHEIWSLKTQYQFYKK
jgi:aldose 1-epimerase